MPLPPANTEAGAAVRGILLMFIAVSFFACLDTTAKYLARTMPSAEIVWLRYTFHVILLGLFFRVWRDFTSFRTRRPLMQILRGLTLLGATFFNFWALRYLQLAEAAAIMFASPLVVTALAGPFLGEKIGIRRWIAVIVGFVGVLIVLRPGTDALHWSAGLSLCAMASYACYSILTRKMHQTETSESLMMLAALVGIAVLLPVAPAAVMSLDGWQWVLAVAMGFFGATGHYALVTAHRIASASTLAPFIYMQMIWMLIFGYIVFRDVPDVWTMVGSAVIAAAGIYILHRERIRGQRVAIRDSHE